MKIEGKENDWGQIFIRRVRVKSLLLTILKNIVLLAYLQVS